jgi:fluoride exporter
MEKFLWISLGSAAGGGARYLVSLWAVRAFGETFPFGTLIVNLFGSFLVSVLMFAGLETSLVSPTVRIALTTGVMGGFTTYSTFSFETMRHLQQGAWDIAIANVVITMFGCLAASFMGWSSARWLLG